MMKLRPRTRKPMHMKSHRRAGSQAPRKRRLLQAAAGTDGAQLLEFALVLPFLLVFLVGIIDFGGAFTLKQKMSNAAREGARIAISNSLSDITCSGSNPPCAIQAAASAVAQYMTNNGANASCINPSGMSATGYQTWTYTCPNGLSLTINRAYTYTPTGGSPIGGTQVILTYPYSWVFNNVIKLLLPGANPGLPTRLTETAVMKNLVTS